MKVIYTTYNLKKLLTAAMLLVTMSACHDIEEWDNDATGNFEALWTIIDQHYCFLEEKGVDWDEVHERYSSRVYNGMPYRMLFNVCADMVNELRDGHVNLAAAFNTSYYRDWWCDYPQNYNQRLVEQYYLKFDPHAIGGIKYAILSENIGYLSYPSFTMSLGEGNIDAILNYFWLCNGLIIDIRDNGGGELTNAEDLIKRFITEETLVGYMVTKNGPGRNDFSEPKPYSYSPAESPHLLWRKPVVVLTNSSCFSAANNFVSIMKYLPNVRIVGARTGGGSGMPMTFEIPCGWSIRLSTVSILDAKGKTTEFGIDPSPGCQVDLDPVLALSGKDTMIEKAIQVINDFPVSVVQ